MLHLLFSWKQNPNTRINQKNWKLFGHSWVDKTRPHNLLADWSQEGKKSNKFTEKLKRMRRTKMQPPAHRYMFVSRCHVSAAAFNRYMSRLDAGVSVLHALSFLLIQGASACRPIFNACVKTMRISHSHMQATHSYVHTHSRLSPLTLFVTLGRRKIKK